MVVDDAPAVIEFQLITKERRKSQLAHQGVSELIERIRQDNHLAPLSNPGDKLDRTLQRAHLVDDTLDIVNGELVLIQNSQSSFHEGIVIRHLAGGDL